MYLMFAKIGANLIGSIDQISGRREDSEMFFSMSGFASPGTSYRVEFSAEDISPVLPVMYRTVTVDGISADDFVTEQVFFESKDGTKIPMFITSHKDAKRDGTAPVLQYGCESSQTLPTFDCARLADHHSLALNANQTADSLTQCHLSFRRP